MGVGLVLFSAHNYDQPGLNQITFPAIGTLLVLFAAWFSYMRGFWTRPPKQIWIPLSVISASIVIAGIMEWNYHGLGTALMGLCLFEVFMAGRGLGTGIFKVFTVAVIIECAIVIFQGIAHLGIRTGGFYGGAPGNDFGNYAMALRLLAFGFLVSMHIRPSRRWLLLSLVTVALVFTGAEEALLVGGIIGVVVLLRRDIGRRLLIVSAGAVVLILVLLPTGIPQQLFISGGGPMQMEERLGALVNGDYEGVNKSSGHRLEIYKRVIENIAPFGHGYYVTEFGGLEKRTPHNVPLAIADQVGPLAALAWVCVTVYMAWKTKWRYLFIGILALSVLDHALWTQAAVWWWAAVGVASETEPGEGTDKVFAVGKGEVK